MNKQRVWAPILIGALAVVCAIGSQRALAQQTALSRAAGVYYASAYNYGSGAVPGAFITVGNSATGSQTITVCFGGPGLVTSDGRTINPFSTSAPITIDRTNGSVSETVTPTAVSSFQGSALASGTSQCANITATFANTHGASLNPLQVASGSFGLVEAMLDANNQGGGTVVVDAAWGGTTSTITAVTAATPKVWIEDLRGPGSVTWFGKSGLTTSAYSASNHDATFSVTMVAGTVTKTLSQTYSVAPSCQGGATGTLTGVLKIAPTTSTVVVSSTVTTDTATVAVHCDFPK